MVLRKSNARITYAGYTQAQQHTCSLRGISHKVSVQPAFLTSLVQIVVQQRKMIHTNIAVTLLCKQGFT